MNEIRSYVDCSLCGWDQYADTDPQAKMLAVLHVLSKHPDDYHRETGVDPDRKKAEYKDFLRAFREFI